VLHDLFAGNAYWELSATQARAKKLADVRWQLTLDLRARKLLVDDTGAEHAQPLDEWVEIGVYPGAAKKQENRQVIVGNGGYGPATVRVKAGNPVRLVFDRRDTGACSDEVVFPDFGIKRFLPTGQKTTIEVTPAAPGRYEFTCGMSMHRGVLIAEA
jgi:plastocyanin